MTRVMHVLETIYSGGVERRKLELCRAAPGEGFECTVVCSKARGPIKSALESLGVDIHTIGESFDTSFISRARRLVGLIRQYRPDILHCSVIDAYSIGALAGRWCNVPLVIIEETSDPQNRRIGGHSLAKFSALLAHHCIAISPSVGRYLEHNLKIPTGKITVIPNGVAPLRSVSDSEREELRAALGISNEEFLVGSVGRMFDDTHKRFSDLIEALSLEKTPSNIKLLLVGDGKERTRLEQHAKNLGVASKVSFVGFQEDTAPFYASMDLFALASAREGFGLVNVEAMLAGLPVVATSVGGIPDIVEDGVTGIIVSPGDIVGFVNAFSTLAKNSEYCRNLGLAGKQRALEHFSSQRYCRDVYDLYVRHSGHIA